MRTTVGVVECRDSAANDLIALHPRVNYAHLTLNFRSGSQTENFDSKSRTSCTGAPLAGRALERATTKLGRYLFTSARVTTKSR